MIRVLVRATREWFDEHDSIAVDTSERVRFSHLWGGGVNNRCVSLRITHESLLLFEVQRSADRNGWSRWGTESNTTSRSGWIDQLTTWGSNPSEGSTLVE